MSKYSRQICIFLLFLLGMSIEMNNFAARKLVTNETNMAEKLEVKELDQVVVRFSGDSGDGMQLAGNIFSTVSATVGNGISTFPDYPADIRAPQGSLTGVSGFQVHIGAGKVYTPGDKCDVLVAMNAAALKTQYRYAKPGATIIIDTDSFGPKDLEKAQFKTEDYLGEMNIDPDRVIQCPLTTMVKDCLAETGMDNKAMLKCRNMFALGLVCWLFDRDLNLVSNFLKEKFAKKPAIAEANIKVIQAGYDYGHNTHSSTINVYRVESKEKVPGRYMDITGNKATAYGFIAAAEKAGLKLYLGSYPITPATDVLHELSKHKSCGVITVQCEDEIAGCSSALGASFAGALGVTSTSGPGICLKSEAMNLAVIMELPLVVLDVQRGGPATGLPTKSEQTDLLQALFGRNGESPMPVMAATSPTDCFDAAYQACKIALEHMTPVVLLTDAFVANGSGAFKLPEMAKLDPINPPYVPEELKGKWTPYMRAENGTRYWAVPGREGFTHILGGLEKDSNTGAISTNPENHDLMTRLRQQKIANIQVPDLEVDGDVNDADLLIVGFGSTYGHLRSAMDELRQKGYKVAQTHFKYLNPLPKNTAEVLTKYNKVVVAEQNMGQLAGYLRMKVDNFVPFQFNQVKGQPFVVEELVNAFEDINLTVWQVSGDGDGLAIGGNHFIHANRRNIDLNMILLNNRIYGLTKGQYSPTSPRGFVSKSSPYGTVEDPFRPAELCFGARGHFFARCVATDAKGTVEVLKAAYEHKGASVTEVLQNCVIFNDHCHDVVYNNEGRKKNAIYVKHGEKLVFGENNEFGLVQQGFGLKVVEIGKDGYTIDDVLVHDAHCEDNTLQLKLALMGNNDGFPIALGVIRDVEAPTYNESVYAQLEEVSSQKKYHNFEELLETNDIWTVE